MVMHITNKFVKMQKIITTFILNVHISRFLSAFDARLKKWYSKIIHDICQMNSTMSGVVNQNTSSKERSKPVYMKVPMFHNIIEIYSKNFVFRQTFLLPLSL